MGEGGVLGRNGFPDTAIGCARAWCGVLSRMKNGYPEDRPLDVEPKFAELIRQGLTAKVLLDEIFRADRKRTEYFWQLEKRLDESARKSAGQDKLAEVFERLGEPKVKK